MVTFEIKLKTPRVPNFIQYDEGEGTISVGDLTDDQLKSIGEEWTADLIARANVARNNKQLA